MLVSRPVQRLPSISLLLSDLLKHTQRSLPNHPDCQELDKALAKIKEVVKIYQSICARELCLCCRTTKRLKTCFLKVMTHLNEEKRRTEGQIHIFDIYSEIENCPASVVSSHRRFAFAQNWF